MLIAAFYTFGTLYELEAKSFQNNVREILPDMPLYIRAYPSTGSWEGNCQLKARFLRSLADERDCPVLYLDVDARIKRPITLFDELARADIDLAVRFRKNTELLSGTMFLRFTTRTFDMLNRWIKMNEAHPTTWDQRNLQKVVEEMERERGLRVHRLPPEYTFIFDLDRRDFPNAEPVIEHMQASRRYKRSISRA